MGSEDISAEIKGYENLIAEQFDILEILVKISKKERDLILNESLDALTSITEEKEVVLDKFGLLEDKTRLLLQTMSQKLGIHSEKTNIQEILPFIEAEDAARIKRLLDGVKILVGTAKELNLGNQALTAIRLDWLSATQSFISTIIQRDDCYSMPMTNGMNRNLAISGLDFQA
jgi:hypothetical protein